MVMLNRNTDRLSLAARRLDGGITVRTLFTALIFVKILFGEISAKLSGQV